MSNRKRPAEPAIPTYPAAPTYKDWAKFNFEDNSLESFFNQFPQAEAGPIRAKKQKSAGLCVQHPVEKEYYIELKVDPGIINNDEIVRYYTFESTADLNRQRAQLTTIPHGVYNFILFTDSANTKFILHMMYMNPGEYHNKHIDLLAHAEGVVSQPNFMYSGEIRFDGTFNVAVNDISSLYFKHVKSESITLAFQLLFPDMRAFINSMAPAGIALFNSLKFEQDEEILKRALIMHFNIYYNKADGTDDKNHEDRLLKIGVKQQIDIILRKMFTSFMEYALRMIFGTQVQVQYAEHIYKISQQKNLSKAFMDTLCRAKTTTKEHNYASLYFDENCTNKTPNTTTWCSYTKK